MTKPKNIALVAHDRKKLALVHWASLHHAQLITQRLYATGSTGNLIEKNVDLTIHKLESGPLGGDQQIGAMIVEGKIDALIFFWDPLEAQPHDPDVRALLRIAVVWNIPVACNESTADLLMTSNFLNKDFTHEIPNYSAYRNRDLNDQ